MPRIRTHKPEFWTDAKNLKLPKETRLFFLGLWNFCDDEGKCRLELAGISAKLGGQWTPLEVKECIKTLLSAGQLRISKDHGWVQVTSWDEDQRIDKPQTPKILASQIEWKPLPEPKPEADPFAEETDGQTGVDPGIEKNVVISHSRFIPVSFPSYSAQGEERRGEERKGIGKEEEELSSLFLKPNFIFGSLSSSFSPYRATCGREKEKHYNYDTAEKKDRIRCTITRPARDLEDLTSIVGEEFWQREAGLCEEGLRYVKQVAREALSYYLSGKARSPVPQSRNEWERTLKYWINNPENLHRYRKMQGFALQAPGGALTRLGPSEGDDGGLGQNPVKPASVSVQGAVGIRSQQGSHLEFSMKTLQ